MDEYEEESNEGGGGFQLAHLASYLAFGKRALRQRWHWAVALFVGGFALTIAALVFLPKTYTCKTVLMALGSPLDRSNAAKPLTGAEGLILSHENLENIIRDTQLVKNFESRRPPLLKLKDRIMGALFTKPDDETKIAQLVGTLETKLDVEVDKDSILTIKADWSDGQTAAQLAEAARESFLKSRHTAEISAFEDQMTIIDGHASKLRDEINALADQLNADEQAASPQPATATASPRKTAAVAARPARAGGLNPDSMLAEDITSMKEKLAADKPKLADAENDWQRKLHEEQAKLADLKLRFTPTHPDVVTEQQRVAILTEVPSQVAMLRSEVQTLEQDIKGREALAKLTPTAVAAGAAQAGSPDPLPSNVIQALSKEDTDPALRAQLSGAITKYRDLRDDIRSGRIELDTAQAAFNHRYQLVMPAEVPSKPQKPKPALILAGGLMASLLLALALPILAELRRGVIVEAWQVHHLQLPVLAELQLPPHDDS